MKFSSPLLALPFCYLVLSCSSPPPGESSGNEIRKFSEAYKPPVFNETDRLAVLQSTFSVVEKIFKTYAEENHFPAIAYGIVADGQLVLKGATGFVNLNKKTPATSKSMFRIASMTKSFTAMAIVKLRDEGSLNFTDPVSKYIGEMREITYLTEDSPEITIHNLLTMTAGFPEDNPWGDRQLADRPEDLKQFIREGLSFSNVPSREFEYSNMGYAMLGMIVSKVSGMPYQQYISNNILKPLGMNDTKWEYSEVDPELLALGYRWEDGQWKEEPLLHDGIYGAMGGLITSIEDFSKYVNLHLSAWPPRNGPETGPVKRSSIREMHKGWEFRYLDMVPSAKDGKPCAVTGGYGYGLGWRRDCDGIDRISHSGGLPGFGSEYRFYPDYGIGIISFANLTYASAGQANSNAVDTLLSISGIKSSVIPVSDTLQKRKEQLVELIKTWNEDLGKSILAENFYMDLSREGWIRTTRDIFKQTGAIVKVGEVEPENQLRGKFMLQGEKLNAEVFFTLTPENSPKIQELNVALIKEEVDH